MKAFLWFGLAVTASAVPPGLENLVPAGGQVGSKVELTVAGKGLESGKPVAWCSNPGVTCTAGDKPKKFIATIAKEAKPGPCLVRFYTAEGVTPPRIFVVGEKAEFGEKEPNDAFADAQKTEARGDAIFNGVLEKSGDIDTHAIQAKKGQTLVLELQGYALGSPMDPAMRLLDARGVEIAGGHDTHNLDPRIVFTPQADGVLYAQVLAFAHPPAADVALKGSANHVYRLAVVSLATETAPQPEPAKITVPAAIRGVLAKPREEDVFGLTAKKGDEFAISARSRFFDAVLRVDDADGKTLAQADDDADSLNAVLKWKAAKDGEVKVVVADRFHSGSAQHAYELEVKPFTPSLMAQMDTHAYRIEAGKSTEVKLTVKANGAFAAKLSAKAVELPAGVSADAVEVPTKGGEVKLTLKATAEAAASEAPFRIEITDGTQTFAATYLIPFTEPRGDLLITRDEKAWLSVVAKKK